MRKKIVYAVALVAVVVAVALFAVYRMFYGSAVENSFTLDVGSDDSYATVVERVKQHISNGIPLRRRFIYTPATRGISS